MCNRELQERLGMDQPILSQHLTKMREGGLVDCVKEGRNRYYFIKVKGFSKVIQCIDNCLSGS